MKRIAIHSVPRSGSSWLGQIVNSSPKVCFRFQPLFSYTFKSMLDEESNQDDIISFFDRISESDDDFLLQSDKIKSGEYPAFIKEDVSSHVIYKEVRYHNILENILDQDSELKVIGLVRSPFSVVNSFLESPKEFRKDLGWLAKDEWRFADKKNLGKKEEFFGYEKWKEVYILFKRLEEEYKGRFCLVFYDDLIKDTFKEVERIFKFCEIQMSTQTISFLTDKKGPDTVYSVYRKKMQDDKWKSSLDPLIASQIRESLREDQLLDFLNIMKK